MNVLIGCEFSGIVRDAFIKRGHNAISCDLLPTDSPGPHYQGDILRLLDQSWDLIIAHPPCTYLAVSGCRWLYNKDGSRNEERFENQRLALEFVRRLMDAGDKNCIENPVSVISSKIKKPTQIIQPCDFGHPTTKKTCLWLKGLPKLTPTKIVDPEFHISSSGRSWDKWFFQSSLISNLEERSKFRSTTFQGIADAMANQWGKS